MTDLPTPITAPSETTPTLPSSATPRPSSSVQPTSPAKPSRRSARRRHPLSKRKREPEDPNVTKIYETILQQQLLLQTLAQPAAPPGRDNCLLKLFADTWSSEFSEWPRSLQSEFIHKITLMIEEMNNRINSTQNGSK